MQPERLPVPVEPAPLALIQQALEAKIPPSELKDLFDLQVRYEQRRAEEAYADAITAFQAWCPTIHKSKDVKTKGGGKAYGYAPFEEIMKIITPGLRQNRIVISFDTRAEEGTLNVLCRVRVGVVEKVTTVTLPVPPTGPMTNPTQATVGAVSYGKRTSLCAALNIVCTDEDDDGQAAGFVTDQQRQDIENLLADLAEAGHPADLGRFCALFSAGSLREIQARDYFKARRQLEQAIAKMKQQSSHEKAGGAA